jgi:Rab GDP dissociation inhibitor
MDGSKYDIVVMGTGITESILSGLLSMEGNKILNIDRNPFYGDSGASLNISNIWKKFKPNEEVPKELGHNRDWNIDLTPKFVMAYGKLVKLIIKTEVNDYLNWKLVEGTYVYQWSEGGIFSKKGGKIKKVPANDKEALTSDLMSLFEKRRCQKFFKFVQNVELTNPDTFKGKPLNKMTFGDLVKDFGLEENTCDFLGHAVALYTDNSYNNLPAFKVIKKLQLYMNSVGRFGDSPFIYPVYGLAGIPESFSRKSAVYGGTYMLNVSLTSIETDTDGLHKITGIWDEKEGCCYTKKIIAHPSYLETLGMKNRIKKVSTTIRSICILDHPIPGTGKQNAVQIILPQNHINRKSDIYIMMLGPSHGVCKKGYYLAIVSTTQEHENIETDLKVAFELIGNVLYRFDMKEDMYKPVDNGTDNIFITCNLDATSHFESSAQDVLNVYSSMTGKELDLNIKEEKE